MDASKLTDRVRIERKSVAVDADYGTQVVTWSEVATVWAQVLDQLPSKGEAEGAEGALRIAQRPTRVRFRWMEGITSAMRLVLLDRGSRVCQIISGPAQLGRREGIEVMAADYSTAGDGL